MIGQYAVPDTVAVESSMLLSFSTLKHMSMASRAILSNFFEVTVNSKPPTIPFGIVARTFPTTFLEIAVYLAYAAFRAQAVLSSLTDILAHLEQSCLSLVFLVWWERPAVGFPAISVQHAINSNLF